MMSGLLVTAAAVAAVALVLVVIDRWAGDQRTLDHEVASTIFNMVGVLYAVLLAFVVVQVWQTNDDAQHYSQAEASDVSAIYFTARALPQPQRDQLKDLARSYAETVATEEWPAMAHGATSPRAVADVAQMRVVILSYRPQDYRGQVLMTQILDSVDQTVDARRNRTSRADSPVPTVMWVGLLAGGAITVGFTLSFGYGRLRHQILMCAAVAGLLAFTLWLVQQMGHPYAGSLGVGPDAFTEVLGKFRQYP
jgi:hypothetical protein